MERLLKQHSLILMEAAVVERLRRSPNVDLHPTLVNAPLIYSRSGRSALRSLYVGYLSIAADAEVPLLMLTPTWRADRDRVFESDANRSINVDAVKFMSEIRDATPGQRDEVKIGGLVGARNDCYRPEEALSTSEAEQYHAWQIDQLVAGGVDYLIAETLPSVQEAVGIARAMAKTGIPYIISFVTSRDGCVLDGTGIATAVEHIDEVTEPRPLGFMVNCAYPSFLCPEKQPKTLFDRLIGCQGNASSLDHCDLDGADGLEMDGLSDWGDLMIELNTRYGVQILGGCCGTGPEHLRYIVDHR